MRRRTKALSTHTVTEQLKPVMADNDFAPLERLRIADPDTCVWVRGRLTLISPIPGQGALNRLVDATIWGLSQEPGLGEAVAKGMLRLMAQGTDRRLYRYEALVRQAAETGPTLGRIMATFLAPVLAAGDAFLDHFQTTVGVMLGKGTYTLVTPLEVMVELLSAGDKAGARGYLELLDTTFSQSLSYNQSLRLVYLLPKAVSELSPRRRRFQIAQMNKVAAVSLNLVDAFIDGLARGSGLLDASGLAAFVGQALELHKCSPGAGEKFLSLSSKIGKEACALLQRAVPLSQVAAQLNRYLNARIGTAVAVKPVSELPPDAAGIPWIGSDGRFIYLPDEIDFHRERDANGMLFRTLTRLEAGLFECRTFDFDLEKACDGYPEIAACMAGAVNDHGTASLSDGERFIHGFTHRELAADLFDLFEQARVARYLGRHYPGLMRQVMPILCSFWQALGPQALAHPLAPVYDNLVLAGGSLLPEGSLQQRLTALYDERMDPDSPVEAAADLVCRAYARIRDELGRRLLPYAALKRPFDRRLHWDLVGRAFADRDHIARQIQERLAEQGLRVYRSDLRNRLGDRQGGLSADDIADLVLTKDSGAPGVEAAADLSAVDWEALFGVSADSAGAVRRAAEGAFCYPEWDHHLQDYLADHTRVYEIDMPAEATDDFYDQVLLRYRGLLARMRRAFELLKPEGLTLLRQWPEGDAFDYRALLDFAMDRRAGLIPSDRLFIKRLKHERDVSVMLLVDLSRSTANTVSSGQATVLDVAKEALVLFCEALGVVGDAFAIAGFSGTGRHSVDFYGIKGFGENMNHEIRTRISALRPQRSTRMGAAIRHAGTLLAKADARVRLMIVVSDGFPNDLGYKAEYAIADTRRAVQEVRSRNFHVKAITVNVGSDPRLDDLYGRNHHHVIGDVRELPDKLLRLYGTLTRC